MSGTPIITKMQETGILPMNGLRFLSGHGIFMVAFCLAHLLTRWQFHQSGNHCISCCIRVCWLVRKKHPHLQNVSMHIYQFPSLLCFPPKHILPPKIKVSDTYFPFAFHLTQSCHAWLDSHDINNMFQQVCNLYVRNHWNHPNVASSLLSPLQKWLVLLNYVIKLNNK